MDLFSHSPSGFQDVLVQIHQEIDLLGEQAEGEGGPSDHEEEKEGQRTG